MVIYSLYTLSYRMTCFCCYVNSGPVRGENIYHMDHTILTGPKWQQYSRVLFIRTPLRNTDVQHIPELPQTLDTRRQMYMHSCSHLTISFLSQLKLINPSLTFCTVCMISVLWPSVCCRVQSLWFCGSGSVFPPLFFFFFATHRYTITYQKIREYTYIYIYIYI